MRNWNSRWVTKYVLRLASRLPMRNWNSRFHRWAAQCKHCASRLPMRNWNGTLNPYVYHWWYGFQTTYEELKQLSYVISGTIVLLASRLPMRNWNWSFRGSLHWQQRFQTTYEELKLERRMDFDVKVQASRLPMRNWNSSPLFLYWFQEVLPDYLWGIETCFKFIRSFVQRRFQTTYEELKLPANTTLMSFNFASRLPMRNWNALLASTTKPSKRLPDYLWGIETNLKRKINRRSFQRFQTTYEELKRRLRNKK